MEITAVDIVYFVNYVRLVRNYAPIDMVSTMPNSAHLYGSAGRYSNFVPFHLESNSNFMCHNSRYNSTVRFPPGHMHQVCSINFITIRYPGNSLTTSTTTLLLLAVLTNIYHLPISTPVCIDMSPVRHGPKLERMNDGFIDIEDLTTSSYFPQNS